MVLIILLSCDGVFCHGFSVLSHTSHYLVIFVCVQAHMGVCTQGGLSGWGGVWVVKHVTTLSYIFLCMKGVL